MDSARKRKAAEASAPGATSKRIKLLNTNHASTAGSPNAESETDVQRIGLKLVGMLRNAADKTGRPIADAFLTLPSRKELPDYYEQIKLPIAIDTIETKLKRGAYPTVTTVESDVKRMIQNAKDFNMPKSEIFEDAERMRKLAYNYMKINNPAYKLDPTYSSFPTPIPAEGAKSNGKRTLDAEETPTKKKANSRARQSIVSKTSEPPSEEKTSPAGSKVVQADEVGDDGNEKEAGDEDEQEEEQESNLDFAGKTFAEAQQMIISELLSYTDDEGLEVFTPFTNLPSRDLRDYYRMIKHPVSLKLVQKRTRGQHGRASPTGVTDFKTWDAFQEEVSFIWKNAREYNEDGSEMYDLAGELEVIFKKMLQEAKLKVEEPASMRIKLGAPKPKSGITLNLSQPKNSPTPGAATEAEMPARQRSAAPTAVVSKNADHEEPGIGDAKAESGAPESQTEVKDENRTTQSPVRISAAGAQPPHTGSLQPAVSQSSSASPIPPSANGFAPVQQPVKTVLLQPAPIRAYPISQALLPMVTITSSSRTHVSKPYVLTIRPHATLAIQHAALSLPSAHSFLQIAPTISRELSIGRAYKIFVSLNGMPLLNQNTQLNPDTGMRTHAYDGSLALGTNRIDVEIAAAKPENASGTNKGLDIEKLTIFANLVR